MNCIVDVDNHDYYWTEYTAVRYAYNYFDKNKIAYDAVLPTK